MADFVDDVFTDSNRTGLGSHTETGAGGGWSAHSSWGSKAEIYSNQVRSSNAGSVQSGFYNGASPAGVEYDVQADIIAGDDSSTDRVTGIWGRVSTSANTLYRAHINGSTVYLQKVEAGSETTLDSWGTSWAASDTFAIKLEIRDATKKVYVGGTERCTSSDNSITAAGKAGLQVRGRSGGDWRIDNFLASDAAGGGTTAEQVPSGLIQFNGAAPSAKIVGNQSFEVPAGALNFAGLTPKVAALGEVSQQVPVGGITFNGVAPAVKIIGNQSFGVPTGSLAFGGVAPKAQITGGINEQIPVGRVTFTGIAPTVSIQGNQSFEIPAGAINFSGIAPRGALSGVTAQFVPLGLFQFQGIAPSVSIQGSQSEQVPSNVIQFRGAAPRVTVFDPSAVVAPAAKTAGGGPKTHKGRAVIIGKRRYVVYSYTEERYLLAKHLETLHRKQVRAQAVKTKHYRQRRIKLLATAIDKTEQQLAEVERKWQQEEDELLLLLVA